MIEYWLESVGKCKWCNCDEFVFLSLEWLHYVSSAISSFTLLMLEWLRGKLLTACIVSLLYIPIEWITLCYRKLIIVIITTRICVIRDLQMGDLFMPQRALCYCKYADLLIHRLKFSRLYFYWVLSKTLQLSCWIFKLLCMHKIICIISSKSTRRSKSQRESHDYAYTQKKVIQQASILNFYTRTHWKCFMQIWKQAFILLCGFVHS